MNPRPLLLLLALAVAGCAGSGADTGAGLPNLHRVDRGVWRGAQPTAAGAAELERLGVRTVLSLRHGGDDEEILRGTGIDFVHVPMETFDADRFEIERALAVLRDPARRPIYVHCRRGADRTGVVVALYRVTEQGWSKEEAIREMTEGGFGFNPLWTNLVRRVREW